MHVEVYSLFCSLIYACMLSVSCRSLFVMNWSLVCLRRRHLRRTHLVGFVFSFTQAMTFFTYAAIFYFGAWLIAYDGLAFDNMFKLVYTCSVNDSFSAVFDYVLLP
jgi:hypothetical protein